MNAVIAGKHLYLDSTGFQYVGDEDAEIRGKVVKLAEILYAEK